METKTPRPGASAAGRRRVTLTCDAPGAQRVQVTGTFCDWEVEAFDMKPDPNGLWKRMLYLDPGRHEYRFVVDGEWCDDPACSERVPNGLGGHNSVLNVPATTRKA
jgi:1,4-alpha-glucan branching enzyme